MAKIFLVFLSCFFITSSIAGIRNDDSKKWQNIDDKFLIDTKTFNIEDSIMYFWVKNLNYKQRRLTINCSTLEEKERYKQESTEWNPIFSNSAKYQIVNQLCFLTDPNTFSQERRSPTWAEQIIKNQNKKSKTAELIQKTNTLKKKQQVFID